MKQKNHVWSVLFWGTLSVLCLLAVIARQLCSWFDLRFGVGFEELLFTLTSPLAGADVSFMEEAVVYVLPKLAAAILVMLAVFCLLKGIHKLYIQITVRIFHVRFSIGSRLINALTKCCCAVLAVAFTVSSFQYSIGVLGIREYLASKKEQTTIYEEYYVNPATVNIEAKGQPKNLIYIFVESLETTYASKAEGGFHKEVNYIPNLTRLAQENLSFSDREKLGGAYVAAGTGWTMGALLGITSGVPFAFPVGGNAMGKFAQFAPGLNTLGDVLQERGYTQVFLCGSDGSFAGRQTYFEQHGNYEVRDLFYAREKGYIPEDYYVWWGYEDFVLYDIAKQEIPELAKQDKPFNYTMLTVDTHHVDGNLCKLCEETYDHKLGNVLACADKQILEFLTWCQEQEFYKDTVIIITGDHLRMDASLVGGSRRLLYNCMLNCDTPVELSCDNRIFTSLDLFPTTLAAMGWEIEGDRLGLGTNLFSAVPTLAEELGLEEFQREISSHSDYYLATFN